MSKYGKVQQKIDITIKDSIYIVSLLYFSFLNLDLDTKNSVLKYCGNNLTDNQFKKIHKSCVKFVERTGKSVEEYNLFLQNFEVS